MLEMALGEPPMMGQTAAMALSLIPKSSAPRLQGEWSQGMKEFVAAALQENPDEVCLTCFLIFAFLYVSLTRSAIPGTAIAGPRPARTRVDQADCQGVSLGAQ